MTISGEIYRAVVCQASEHHPRYNNGSIVPLDDGSLLLVYQCWYTKGSADASPGRVEGKLSSDGGRTWGTEFIIKESYEPDLYHGGGRRMGSPSLLKLESGQLLLFHSEDDHRNFLSRSFDGGLTWSESVPIVGRLGYYVINNDRVVRLSSGRILVPVANHGSPFDRRGVSFGLYSDDEGRTWTRGLIGRCGRRRRRRAGARRRRAARRPRADVCQDLAGAAAQVLLRGRRRYLVEARADERVVPHVRLRPSAASRRPATF